jgi:hypothetical protein
MSDRGIPENGARDHCAAVIQRIAGVNSLPVNCDPSGVDVRLIAAGLNAGMYFATAADTWAKIGGAAQNMRIVNVLDAPFNADPTGVTDSTAAINAAIASMGLIGLGGIVWFPKGTYLVTGTLLIPREQVWCLGEGPGSTIINHAPTAGGTNLFYIHEAAGLALSEIKIKGFSLLGTANTNALIYAFNCQELNIENIRPRGGGIAIYLRDGYDMRISDVKTSLHTTCGVLIGEVAGGAYPTTVKFSACDLSDNPALGVWVRKGASINFSRTTFESNGSYGLRCDLGTVSFEDSCHFEANTTGNVWGPGIDAADIASFVDIGSFHGTPTGAGPAYVLDFARLQYFGDGLNGVGVSAHTQPIYLGGAHDIDQSRFTGEQLSSGWDGIGASGRGSQYYGFAAGLIDATYVQSIVGGPTNYAPNCRFGGTHILNGSAGANVAMKPPTQYFIGQTLTMVFLSIVTLTWDAAFKTNYVNPGPGTAFGSVTFRATPQKDLGGGPTGFPLWIQVGGFMAISL